MKTYIESVRLLFRLRKLMGFSAWKRPAFPCASEWMEWVEAAGTFFGMILVVIIWPFVWLMAPLQPFWLPMFSTPEKIRRSVAKWERDLATPDREPREG